MSYDLTRRQLVGTSLGVMLGGLSSFAVKGSDIPPADVDKRMFLSVKWGMIEISGSVLEKFQLCRDLGFSGMELISPFDGFTADEVVAARQATDMPVHGVVDMKHWEIRLSSPNPDTRDAAVTHLRQALVDCAELGGYAVLLVPGKVNQSNETHEQVWHRSIDGIRKVLPVASRLGVRILIENVWNGFCEKPKLFRDYIDEINSPWVAVYFDIGNARKFGPSEDWIRVLGNRIVKCDVKDWGERQGFCKIGTGDVNWVEVRRALDDIGFTGWFTAEVPGGGPDVLADIHQRMTKVLGIA